MKKLLLFSLLPIHLLAQNLVLDDHLRFLALGDSYTIGQSVSATGRWPAQLSDSLSVRGFSVDTISIIATTGWRTDDLLNAISNQHPTQQHYNLVSLLIGVNNQFQGKPFSQYTQEFPALLDSAVRYAGNKSRVFVISIPDYAYTPYGQQSGNQAQTSMQLDQYNQCNKRVADSLGIKYFDITPISRQGLQQPSYVASDGLHPSEAQYAQWVNLMLTAFKHQVVLDIKATEDKNYLSVNISPNPGTGNFIIAFTGEKDQQSHAIDVYDVTGKLVIQKVGAGTPVVLSMAEFNDGLYTVRISSGEKQVVKKLVKVKE